MAWTIYAAIFFQLYSIIFRLYSNYFGYVGYTAVWFVQTFGMIMIILEKKIGFPYDQEVLTHLYILM